MVARGWEERGNEAWLLVAIANGVSFWFDENVLELDTCCIILWIYKNHRIICSKRVNFMVCKCYINWQVDKLMELDINYPKFLFPLESLNIIIGNKYYSCFPWSDSHIFNNVSAKYKHGFSCKRHKWTSLGYGSSLPQDNPGLWFAATMLCAHFPFCHAEY